MLKRFFGYDIFISYSAKDRPWAAAIEKLLKLGRYRVFRDDSGLQTGEHLDRLLAEVRRSTMLTVLVSESSMQSDWVYRELQAHLDRPQKKWRIAPLFLDTRYPRELPERFRILGEFHGIQLPASVTALGEIESSRELLADLTSNFNAVRKTTWQRRAAAAVTVAIGLIIGLLVWTNYRNTERDALLRRAEVSKASGRFDEAEAALARAWLLDPAPATLDSYREARARRTLERPVRLSITRQDTVVSVNEAAGKPYVVIHASDSSEGLFLLRDGQRLPLAVPCDVAPKVLARNALIVWSCGDSLGAMLVDQPNPAAVKLPAEPARIRLVDDHVEMLFREGPVSQIGKFQVPALQPVALDVLPQAPEGGEMDFCPQSNAIWSFRASDGRIIFRQWTEPGAQPKIEAFTVPDPSGIGRSIVSWISRVFPADDCMRFFLEYAPFTAGSRSNFEIARIRIDSPRPLDRFDSSIAGLAPAPDESGLEAVYLTESKELRAFVLTSPVVLSTRTRTLASDVQAFARLPIQPREMWTIAMDRQRVSVYRNQGLWSRHPLGVGEPVRAVSSPDGKWIVVEGDEGAILWKGAEAWDASAPPPPESIESETWLRE